MSDLEERFPDLYTDQPTGDAKPILIIGFMLFAALVVGLVKMCYGA